MNLSQLLQAFAGEIEALAPELQSCLQRLRAPADEEAFLGSVQDYASLMQRWAEAAQTADFDGLNLACMAVMENAMLLAICPEGARSAGIDFLADWPTYLLPCLRHPAEADPAAALVQYLSRAPQGLDAQQAWRLMYQLGRMGQQIAQVAQVASFATVPALPLQQRATLDAISLRLPADLDPQLLESFYQEAPQQARRLTVLVQALQSAPLDAGLAPQLVQAQRLAHTLKGSGAIFGLRGISSLAHPLEGIFEQMQNWIADGSLPQQAGADSASMVTRSSRGWLALALDAVHCLEQMVGSVSGQDQPPLHALEVLQALLDAQQQWLGAASGVVGGVVGGAASTPQPGSASVDTTPSQVQAQAEDQVATLRISVLQLEEIFRLSGQLCIVQTTQQGRLKKLHERLQLLQSQNTRWQKSLGDLAALLQHQHQHHNQQHHHHHHQQQARQHSDAFDALELDDYSALHEAMLSLQEGAYDSHLASARLQDEVQAWTQAQQHDEHLAKTLQYEVLQARMRSVASIRARAERTVRITAESTGKQAQLQLEGEQVRVDAALLGSLMEPLMHLLRNAIDHGLETPVQREAAGKLACGSVRLAFVRLGSQVSLRCQDDGRGLNLAAVRRRAEDLGWLQPGQPLADQELARLIFAPGFSTRQQLSEISGRGVGLDVVHGWAASVGGSVDVLLDASQPGLCIELRFPASLSMVPALLVQVAGQRFALPAVQIEQALAPGMGQLHTQADGSLQWAYQGRTLPAYVLAPYLGLPAPSDTLSCAVVLVQRQHHTLALLVDALLDAREWLVKDLGRFSRHAKGATGVSILEDGGLAVHLDVAVVLGNGATAPIRLRPAPAPLPRILVVDDSFSVRSSLRQLLEDAGYAVDTARDGLEAIASLQAQPARVLLTDLEMPNMNGAEITAYLRGQPAWVDLPIIMISSRTHEKHRQLAAQAGVNAYLGKPYAEAELLALISQFLGKKPI